jgi:hypothetical protein
VDAEEKTEQIQKQEKSTQITQGDDLDIITPDPIIFKLGGKDIEVKPLPIEKRKLLVRMSKLETSMTEEAMDELADVISKMLDVDKDFILKNMTAADIVRLSLIIQELEAKHLKGVLDQAKKKREKQEASAG